MHAPHPADRHPLPAQHLDPRLVALATARDRQEVAHHVELTHPAEDDDVQDAVSGIRIGDQAEAQAVVWTDADGHGGCPPN